MQRKNTQLQSVLKIKQKLGFLKPKSLAKKLNLTKRMDRKCTIVDIILGHWQLISNGGFSFDNWAMQVSTITGKTLSGQGLWKRVVRPEIIPYIKALLHKSFKQKCDSFIDSKVFSCFKNVYVQDATHFSLPSNLSNVFPGSYSKYGNRANAKIQAIFNFKKGYFSDFTLNSFRDNDQKDAPRFINMLNKGDLIIRDLGYFVLDVFNQIDKEQAYFLSRFKYNILVFDANTNEKLKLDTCLKNNKHLDLEVFLGKQKSVKCRFVAIPLSDEIANERRRKAKNSRNKKTNHSKEYLYLLGYSIYITNVSKEIWTISNITQAYKTRWYIEILFKSWKSNLKMKDNIPQKHINKQRAEFFFYSTLLMINILVMPIFNKAQLFIEKIKIAISIIKLSEIIRENMQMIINQKINILEQIKYYATYESRKKRVNAIETIYFNIS